MSIILRGPLWGWTSALGSSAGSETTSGELLGTAFVFFRTPAPSWTPGIKPIQRWPFRAGAAGSRCGPNAFLR